MQYQKVATVGIRGNGATNASALSMFLPAIIAGNYFGARASHIDAVIVRCRESALDRGAERGYGRRLRCGCRQSGGAHARRVPRAARFAGAPFDVDSIHVVHVTAARCGKPPRFSGRS